MDDPGVGGLLEWIQSVVEARCGKFWAWTIYFSLIAAMVGAAAWTLKGH